MNLTYYPLMRCMQYGMYAENNRPLRLDPSKVPPDLHDLIPWAERFGVSCDITRHDLGERTSQQDKDALSNVLRGRHARINEWTYASLPLDGSLPEVTDEENAFTCMCVFEQEENGGPGPGGFLNVSTGNQMSFMSSKSGKVLSTRAAARPVPAVASHSVLQRPSKFLRAAGTGTIYKLDQPSDSPNRDDAGCHSAPLDCVAAVIVQRRCRHSDSEPRRSACVSRSRHARRHPKAGRQAGSLDTTCARLSRDKYRSIGCNFFLSRLACSRLDRWIASRQTTAKRPATICRVFALTNKLAECHERPTHGPYRLVTECVTILNESWEWSLFVCVAMCHRGNRFPRDAACRLRVWRIFSRFARLVSRDRREPRASG